MNARNLEETMRDDYQTTLTESATTRHIYRDAWDSLRRPLTTVEWLYEATVYHAPAQHSTAWTTRHILWFIITARHILRDTTGYILWDSIAEWYILRAFTTARHVLQDTTGYMLWHTIAAGYILRAIITARHMLWDTTGYMLWDTIKLQGIY